MKTKNNLDEITELVLALTEQVLRENNPQRLRDIFIQPTKDLIQTVGYAAETLSASIQKTLKGLSLMIPSLLIPGLEFQYSLFAKDEQVKFDAIKKKYGEALANNWEAIKDPDVFGFLLLAYPESMLGFAALKKSPMAFLRVLEVVTGGFEPVRTMRQNLENTAAYSPRTTSYSDPNARNFGIGGNQMGDYYGDYGGMGLSENVAANPDVITRVQALMQDPGVQQAIANSQLFREMRAQAVEVFTAPVVRFFSARDIEDLKKFIDPQAVEKTKVAISNDPGYKKLAPEEKAKADQALFAQIKQTYKNEYMKWLQNLASQQPQTKEEVAQALAKIKNIR